jgi:hypothetical protein
MSEIVRDGFLRQASAWICQGYHLDMRYLVLKKHGSEHLQGAVIGLSPLPPGRDVQFHLDLEQLRAGQFQCDAPEDIADILSNLALGRLSFKSVDSSFGEQSRLSFYSERIEQSNGSLHLRISASNELPLDSEDLRTMDDALRRADPPFDGLVDLSSWLGIENPAQLGREHAIEIRISPPVDFAEDATLVDDTLRVTLRALGSFDVSKMTFGVRVAPGEGLPRHQLGESFRWNVREDGLKYGDLTFGTRNADVIQCMLSVDERTVRRFVAVDRSRARTLRLAVVASLDDGLEQLRAALKSSGKDRDSARFEKAVSMLLFLHGFTPTPHVDTDAPDLLVATPGGRLVIVECTLKVSDFNGKVSKLAGRRARLVSELAKRGHTADVHAVLACAARKDEILGINEKELARHSVLLVTAEDLSRALDEVQHPQDPDDLLLRVSAATMASQQDQI